MWTLKSGFPELYGLFSPGGGTGGCFVFKTMNMITSSKHAHTLEYVKQLLQLFQHCHTLHIYNLTRKKITHIGISTTQLSHISIFQFFLTTQQELGTEQLQDSRVENSKDVSKFACKICPKNFSGQTPSSSKGTLLSRQIIEGQEGL